MNGDDSEVEEVVFVELNGMVDQQWSRAAGQVCRVIGIDSDEPVLQLGRSVFSGQYKDTLGTKVLFECNSKTGADNTQPDSTVLNYAMCVNKVVHMQRVFLTERETDSNCPSSTASTSVPAEQTEGNDASTPESLSLAMDAASADISGPPADEPDKVTLHSQDASVQQMDLSVIDS